ncbi:homoserine O-succinyltransferase, partial [bacterium]|nr:homoserine O-succinyltransferase [bacterium]
LQIVPVWIRISSHTYSADSKKHLDDLYVTFGKAVYDRPLDGLIIAGAPDEEVEFDKMPYWEEIASIIEFARKNIISTLGICWGGMALAKALGLEKQPYEKKLFGIYEARNLIPGHSITGDLDDTFMCPQSRFFGYPDQMLEAERDKGNLNLLAHSKDAGYIIFETTDHRSVMHLGHPEYNSGRLIEENRRNKKEKRQDVDDPVNFDLEKPINIWRSHRNEFFSQWIKYIYTETSYNWNGGH